MENKNIKNEDKIEFTAEQADILKELGNIGSGNAITALSELLQKSVEMSLTSLDIIPFWKIPQVFDNPTLEVFGILSCVTEKNEFRLLQIFSKESVINMINKLSNKQEIKIEKIRLLEDLDDYSLSIILEIGNILAGHYASSLANLLSISIIPSVPNIALDNISALTDATVAKYSLKSDFTIIIETKLNIEELELIGFICFFAPLKTTRNLLDDINKKFNLKS